MSSVPTASRSAGKLIWHVITTLDGFIAGPNHAMDWAYDPGGRRTG